jgi:hypothetical protein
MEVLTIILAILFFLFYFIPYIIANTRDVEHQGAILTINLLLGWTIAGWLAALIWACTEEKDQPKLIHHDI